MEYKYDWNDILISPAEISMIDSRSEVNVYRPDILNEKINKLPLYVSPMDTVVDENNAEKFLSLGYEVCLPRGIKHTENLKNCFFSFSITQIIDKINDDDMVEDKVLIDIANGNMNKLLKTVKNFKDKYPNKILMVGNVANPYTFSHLSVAGADIVRVGVGMGGGCLTSQNTSIGMPMASLVNEIKEIKEKNSYKTKILADGGFRNYSDIIKALGLGSDSVMLGSILNKATDSCSQKYIVNKKTNEKQKISNEMAAKHLSVGNKVISYFRGMSTKEVQRKWGKKEEELRTSEGVVRYYDVEYTLDGWTENFVDYLKSTMSYCDAVNLSNFIGKVNFNLITNHSYNRFNK